MVHYLWVAHLSLSAVVFIYFILAYILNDMRYIWGGLNPISTKAVISLCCFIGWGAKAFLWEFSLPYMKSVKFKRMMDIYFNW